MLRPTLTRAILAAAALLTLIPATHAAELRSADIHPDDYPTVQAVRQFGELVKHRTNGRITVKVYDGGALVNGASGMSLTKSGAGTQILSGTNDTLIGAFRGRDMDRFALECVDGIYAGRDLLLGNAGKP